MLACRAEIVAGSSDRRSKVAHALANAYAEWAAGAEEELLHAMQRVAAVMTGVRAQQRSLAGAKCCERRVSR